MNISVYSLVALFAAMTMAFSASGSENWQGSDDRMGNSSDQINDGPLDSDSQQRQFGGGGSQRFSGDQPMGRSRGSRFDGQQGQLQGSRFSQGQGGDQSAQMMYGKGRFRFNRAQQDGGVQGGNFQRGRMNDGGLDRDSGNPNRGGNFDGNDNFDGRGSSNNFRSQQDRSFGGSNQSQFD